MVVKKLFIIIIIRTMNKIKNIMNESLSEHIKIVIIEK